MQYSSSSENYSSSFRDSKDKNDKGGYAYKKSSYQYSNSGNSNLSYAKKPVDQNIEQLDALLEDLKNERQFTRDKDLSSSSTLNYRTIDLGKTDAPGTISKSTRIIQTTKTDSNHDLLDSPLSADFNTLRSNDYSTLRYDEKLYESNKSIPPRNLYGSKNQIYESRIVENIEPAPLSTTTTTTTAATTQLNDDLNNIMLTENILPTPGTKVIATVRTYTYEIPPNSGPGITRTHHHSENYSTINNTELHTAPHPHPISNVPQTVVYNTESYSLHNKNNEPPIVTNKNYEIREHTETTSSSYPPQSYNQPLGPTNKTIVYNLNSSSNVQHPEPEPPTTYTRTTTRFINDGPNAPDVYPVQPTTNRYYYKESTNTVNTIRGSPLPSGYPHPQTQPHPHSPLTDNYPNHSPPSANITYKYTTSTTNTRRGPDYHSPTTTLPPAPFPVDGVSPQIPNGSTPQRVDDLMQSFENVDSVNKSDNLQSPHRKREIETAVASPKQQHVPTINKAGKEVFYPPGHDAMLAKREEMAAGSAAGGRWAKGSGMYEYESGYKSKTKTKTGGAMVPVCLPLCCAMPCSIM